MAEKKDEGLLDKLVDKAGDLAEEHGEKIESGIDKAADFVDDKTKGKHRDKIDKATAKAKGAVDDLGDKKRRKR